MACNFYYWLIILLLFSRVNPVAGRIKLAEPITVLELVQVRDVVGNRM
jgi:hypothetical protein